jgi:hypothetical protein
MIADISCMTLKHLAVTNSSPVDKKPRVPPEFFKDRSLARSLSSDCNTRRGNQGPHWNMKVQVRFWRGAG